MNNNTTKNKNADMCCTSSDATLAVSGARSTVFPADPLHKEPVLLVSLCCCFLLQSYRHSMCL